VHLDFYFIFLKLVNIIVDFFFQKKKDELHAALQLEVQREFPIITVQY
jgi:hypothetical protein